MVNRTMAQKRLKQKRQKRLFPRKLAADYIPVGNGPDRFVIQEYKERTRSLAFDQDYLDFLETKQRFHGIPPGRHEVLQHMKRIRTLTPELRNVVIWKTPFLMAQLFYSEDRKRFLIYEENYRTCEIRTSMRYIDRTRCIDAWKTDMIRWVYFSSIDPPSNGSSE